MLAISLITVLWTINSCIDLCVSVRQSFKNKSTSVSRMCCEVIENTSLNQPRQDGTDCHIRKLSEKTGDSARKTEGVGREGDQHNINYFLN